MNYIIFDLEWNNAYNPSLNKFSNEIIEFGALKLNNQLEVVDSFKKFVKPSISKKLSGRCKRITNLTFNEVFNSGYPYKEVLSMFDSWCGTDCLFLSWSNSDLYVLAENSLIHNDLEDLSFIKKYVDAQKYCMSFIENDGNQIALSKFAEKIGVEFSDEDLHRALSDCYLTADCFRKVYDKNSISNFCCECDNTYFKRLLFKKSFAKKPKGDGYDISKISIRCPECNGKIHLFQNYSLCNNTFKAAGNCSICNNDYWINIRVKLLYDGVKINKRIVKMNKKTANRIKKSL